MALDSLPSARTLMYSTISKRKSRKYALEKFLKIFQKSIDVPSFQS